MLRRGTWPIPTQPALEALAVGRAAAASPVSPAAKPEPIAPAFAPEIDDLAG